MCRLFGLHGPPPPHTAEFWLLDAPDSLLVQSHREPDGFGIGTFGPDGTPRVEKSPDPAYRDPDFAGDAHTLRGTVFVAHVRYASTGRPTPVNTHPFQQDGRLFAHNGVIGGLPTLERQLHRRAAAGAVRGDTDSERFFALLSSYLGQTPHDVTGALRSCLSWIAVHLPLYSLNLVLAAPNRLWAVRYPDTHPLWYLSSRRCPARHEIATGMRSSTLGVRGPDLVHRPFTAVASERMTAEPGWRTIPPGHLVRCGPGPGHLLVDLGLPEPAQRMSERDLGGAAASQQH